MAIEPKQLAEWVQTTLGAGFESQASKLYDEGFDHNDAITLMQPQDLEQYGGFKRGHALRLYANRNYLHEINKHQSSDQHQPPSSQVPSQISHHDPRPESERSDSMKYQQRPWEGKSIWSNVRDDESSHVEPHPVPPPVVKLVHVSVATACC